MKNPNKNDPRSRQKRSSTWRGRRNSKSTSLSRRKTPRSTLRFSRSFIDRSGRTFCGVSRLKEWHSVWFGYQVSIENDSTGWSYERILSPCLDEFVTQVFVQDPYIRSHHQVVNFLRSPWAWAVSWVHCTVPTLVVPSLVTSHHVTFHQAVWVARGEMPALEADRVKDRAERLGARTPTAKPETDGNRRLVDGSRRSPIDRRIWWCHSRSRNPLR